MPATDAPEVTITNYVRAESDFQMGGYVGQMDCFGRLVHVRTPYDVHHQVTVRANRDTLYSWGVFDLITPLTVHLPADAVSSSRSRSDESRAWRISRSCACVAGSAPGGASSRPRTVSGSIRACR